MSLQTKVSFSRYVLHIVALFESPVHDKISVIRLIFDGRDVIERTYRSIVLEDMLRKFGTLVPPENRISTEYFHLPGKLGTW